MRSTVLVTLLAAMAAMAACGGDDGGGGNSCEDVNQLVCDLACDCTDGAECIIAAGAVTITHESASDCSGFWVTFGCSQDGADDVDYVACRAALESASCIDTPEGTALEFPAECGDAQ